MYLAQLAAFLLAHHHPVWAAHLTSDTPHQFARVLRWALRHGFAYQP